MNKCFIFKIKANVIKKWLNSTGNELQLDTCNLITCSMTTIVASSEFKLWPLLIPLMTIEAHLIISEMDTEYCLEKDPHINRSNFFTVYDFNDIDCFFLKVRLSDILLAK